MNYAYILSGGGLKGSFQYGIVDTLSKAGIKPSVVSGISVGALNASIITMEDYELLGKLWQSVKDSNGGVIFADKLGKMSNGKLTIDVEAVKDLALQGVSKWDITKAITSSFFNGGQLRKVGKQIADNIDYAPSILDNSPLRKLLKEHVSLDKIKIPLRFGATSLVDGNGYEFSERSFIKGQDDDFVEAILASSNMPIICETIQKVIYKNGIARQLVDGGLRTISPAGMVFDVIDKSPKDEKWTLIFASCNAEQLVATEDVRRNSVRAGRTIDILLNQVYRQDIKMTKMGNLIRGKRKVNIEIIEPEVGILGGTLDATPQIIDTRIEIGQNLATKLLERL